MLPAECQDAVVLMDSTDGKSAYGDAISIFLADALGFGFALLEGVLVLELGPHGDCWRWG